MSKPLQVAVVMEDGVPLADLIRVLSRGFNATCELGRGEAVNGLPTNAILVRPNMTGAEL